MDNKPKIRPYWHLDAKWVVALIFIPVVAITFLIFNFYIISSEKTAVKISTALLSALITPNSNTEKEDIEKLRQEIIKSPEKSIKPFPGTDVKITEADLNNNSASQLKEKLFTELAGNIYNYDSEKMNYNPEGKKSTSNSMASWSVTSR